MRVGRLFGTVLCVLSCGACYEAPAPWIHSSLRTPVDVLDSSGCTVCRVTTTLPCRVDWGDSLRLVVDGKVLIYPVPRDVPALRRQPFVLTEPDGTRSFRIQVQLDGVLILVPNTLSPPIAAEQGGKTLDFPMRPTKSPQADRPDK